MKTILYKSIRSLVKLVYGDMIGSKKIYGTNLRLHYEIVQHLGFLRSRDIHYEKEIQSFIKSFLDEGNVIFDIGGNIGQYAIFFGDIVGGSGKVYSFEPDHKNFAFLSFNALINRCSNVVCLNLGVSNQAGSLRFFRDTRTGGRMGSFIKAYVGEKYEGKYDEVEVKTLDSLIKSYGEPDFVKIDTEGFECDILRGLTIKTKKTKFLVEVREETKEEIFVYFQSRGFTCFHIEANAKILKSTEIPNFANLLFVLKE